MVIVVQTLSLFNILVVDDEELNQRMMRILLMQKGYRVHTVFNGIEALQAIKSNHFDLIFMDLHMPDMDGIEACKHIREWEDSKIHIPVIALTADDFSRDGEECLKAGMDGYISKPFDAKKIFQIIDSLARVKEMTEKNSAQDDSNQWEDGVDIRSVLPFFGNEIAFYSELLGEFITLLPGRLEQMYRDLVDGNLIELSRKAHNLKGVSANLGIRRLASLAFKLDNQSSTGTLDGIRETLDEMYSQLPFLNSYLDNFLNQ